MRPAAINAALLLTCEFCLVALAATHTRRKPALLYWQAKCTFTGRSAVTTTSDIDLRCSRPTTDPQDNGQHYAAQELCCCDLLATTIRCDCCMSSRHRLLPAWFRSRPVFGSCFVMTFDDRFYGDAQTDQLSRARKEICFEHSTHILPASCNAACVRIIRHETWLLFGCKPPGFSGFILNPVLSVCPWPKQARCPISQATSVVPPT